MSIKVTSKIGSRPDLELPVRCPGCGALAGKLKMRDITPGMVVNCTCGAKISLNGDGPRKMQAAMDEIHASLKKLGQLK